MERQVVLGRIGHYFNAGNGACETAIVTDTFGISDAEPTLVNVAGWYQRGASFTRTSVPVDAAPTTASAANSFHLGRDCPWHR